MLKSELPDLEPIAEKTLSQFLLQRVQQVIEERGPGLNFLRDASTGNNILYDDFEPLTRRLASALWRSGIRKGDIVIHMTSYHMHQVPLAMALWRANAILRSIYKQEDSDTVLAKMEESNCTLIFVDGESLPMVENVLKRLSYPASIIVCGESPINRNDGRKSFAEFLQSGGPEGEDCPSLIDESGDDVALILPTSGTTGACKGAMHTHKSFLATIRNRYPLTLHKPTLWCTLPQHAGGTLCPFVVMVSGAEIIVIPKISKEAIAKAVDEYKPGYIMAFPAWLTSLTDPDMQSKYDLSSLEIAQTGGSVVTVEMMENYKAHLPIKDVIMVYGLTEALPLCGTWKSSGEGVEPVSFKNFPPGSVGKLWAGVEAKIIDTQTLQPLQLGEMGELCLKAEFVFKGYYKNEQATENAFLDGFFRTGDICYADKDGFIFMVDRCKEVFKYIGNHMSPTEIENVIQGQPNVNQVVVFPIQDVHVEDSFVPRAAVTLKNVLVKELPNDVADDIAKFANDRLADYKRLRGGVIIVDELPKGKTGKVSRQLAKELYGDQLDK